MSEEIYGWTNKETYRTVLHLQSDLYRTSEGLKRKTKNWIEFSDNLKDLVLNLRAEVIRNPNQKALGILLDIGSLEEVNFDEIARSFLGVDL